MNKVRMPYNINALTHGLGIVPAGSFCMCSSNRLLQSALIGRRVTAVLSGMNTVEVFPSQTNFVLIRIPDSDSAFEQLKQRGILGQKI